jgi:hypothetical protein
MFSAVFRWLFVLLLCRHPYQLLLSIYQLPAVIIVYSTPSDVFIKNKINQNSSPMSFLKKSSINLCRVYSAVDVSLLWICRGRTLTIPTEHILASSFLTFTYFIWCRVSSNLHFPSLWNPSLGFHALRKHVRLPSPCLLLLKSLFFLVAWRSPGSFLAFVPPCVFLHVMFRTDNCIWCSTRQRVNGRCGWCTERML